MSGILPKVKQYATDLLKILIIDTLWVALVIVLTGFIGSFLPANLPSRTVNAVGYLFGALLIGVIIWLKIRPWLLPIGGFYIGALIMLMRNTSLLPNVIPDCWEIADNEMGLIDLPADTWAFLFCLNTVLIQLIVIFTVWLYRRMITRLHARMAKNESDTSEHAVFQWAWVVIVRLVWCGAVSVRVLGSLFLYPAAFSHCPLWWMIGVLTVTAAAFFFPLTVHSKKEFYMSLPVSVVLGCLTAFIPTLSANWGIASLLNWTLYDLHPIANAALNIGINVALEVLALLACRMFIKKKRQGE